MKHPQENERVRLVLVHDHLLLRESLARLLGAEGEFEVVAQCSSYAEARKVLKSSRVDVVLVELALAREFIPEAAAAGYAGKSLVIARSPDPVDSAAVLKEGASGIFLESDSASHLTQAIRLVANGEAWVDRRVIRMLADRFPRYDAQVLGNLTERERTVLDRIVNGLSNRKIGEQIGVSGSRVKSTVQQLFTKAGVRTRSQLVRIALEGTRAS